MDKYKKIILEEKLLKQYIDFFNKIFHKAKIIEEDGKNFLLLNEINIQKLKSLNKPFIKHLISKINSIKSYGIKNGKLNFVDYNKDKKVKNKNIKSIKRGKYFYAKDNNFKKNTNPFPEELKNKIICADSEEFLKKIPENSVDLIFTSPPYNFGLEYENQKDDYDWESYFNKLFKIFDECIRILKYGGRIIVNIQPLFSDYIPSHHIISNYFMNKKLIWKGEILWEKNNYNCKYTAWGSWKSPSNPYLKYTWEFLEIFSKGDLKHSGKKENIDINADEFKEYVIAKWNIAPERKMKEFNHPAMFPEKLVERVLKLFSYKNDIVVDPFNGVGTTSLVAKRLERIYLGIDISKEYCEIAQKRLNSTLF